MLYAVIGLVTFKNFFLLLGLVLRGVLPSWVPHDSVRSGFSYHTIVPLFVARLSYLFHVYFYVQTHSVSNN